MYPDLTLSGWCTTMRIPPLTPLFLILVLIPDPGVSQQGAQLAQCSDCTKPMIKESPEIMKSVIRMNVKTYRECPVTATIRFEMDGGTICAKKYLLWVKQLMKCIDEGLNCKDDASSSSQKESKGTNEKPPTRTTNTPTTAPVTSTKPSTQSWDQNIGQYTEPAEPGAATPAASLAAPSDLNTTLLDPNKANNLPQGKDKSIEHQNTEDQQSKMKHMQIAVISLIAIVLVLVTVVVGVYCQKRKANNFNTPCGSRTMEYTAAPSEDSITEVNVG